MRLAMIVRDEEEIIERSLRSTVPLIDSWCVVDTGSEDRTPEIVRETLADVPGKLVQRPWRDFGHNRSELLSLASPDTDWLLLMDADWTVDGELPELQADANFLSFTGSVRYSLPLIVRGGKPWHYVGKTHEYLTCEEPFSDADLASPAITDHGDGTSRAEKLKRDRKLLEAELATDPSNPRTVFYLAQTYEELGMIDAAISHYRKRTEMGGWEEERFVAQYRLGCLLCSEVSFREGAPELLRAWEQRPQRNEPLRALAHAAGDVADKIPLPDDRLFVGREGYRGGS